MKPQHSLTLASLILFPALVAFAQPAAMRPYTVTAFAKSVVGSYTQPDSIAVLGGNVFVGYGNNVSTTGSDGKTSTIVEYSPKGAVVRIYSVLGHNDGLRIKPGTHQLWAMQNEDANPNLVIIDTDTHTQKTYTFGPTPHGGGYDDIAFQGTNGETVFISASNPANNPNRGPAIVKATINGNSVSVSPVLWANGFAADIPTSATVRLNLQDPDSMIFNPLGDLVLDSQADAELIILRNPGTGAQKNFHLGLTVNGSAAQVDDTVFATSSEGLLLLSDRDGETVYAVTKPIFAPGEAFTAASNLLGRLDLDTGVITPIVTGLVSPHGMVFIGK
jgi:hypothetical protein